MTIVFHFLLGLLIGVAVFWICATLHEIHQDLMALNTTLREKQLEIPSPLIVETRDK